MAQKVDALKLSKVLGRHSRLNIPFSWTIGGTLVDLETDGYTVRVWVTDQTGATISGPHSTVVSGSVANYVMNVDDLSAASEAATDTVKIVAVAETGTMTLVSDSREITVGDWGGADTYAPIV